MFHLCIPIKPKTNMQQKIAAMRADASKLHLVQEKRVSHVRQSPTHFWQVLPSSDPSAGFLDIKWQPFRSPFRNFCGSLEAMWNYEICRLFHVVSFSSMVWLPLRKPSHSPHSSLSLGSSQQGIGLHRWTHGSATCHWCTLCRNPAIGTPGLRQRSFNMFQSHSIASHSSLIPLIPLRSKFPILYGPLLWIAIAHTNTSALAPLQNLQRLLKVQNTTLFQIDPNCSCHWFTISQFHNQFHSHSSRILNSRSSCRW